MAAGEAGSPRSWWALVVPLTDAQQEDRLVGEMDRHSLGAELRGTASSRELAVYFDSRESAQELATSLEMDSRIEELTDGRWVERYQASLAPFDLTPSFRVDPTGSGGAGDRTISLVPGRAFGTGEHPTTRLCALALERCVDEGTRWVDLGCGSAILAIVARRCGAGHVLAIDLDPEAVEVATQVVRQNEIRGIELAVGSYERIDKGRDGIVANILSGFFVDHARELATLVAGGALLVASGYRLEESGLMDRTLKAAGFEPRESFEAEGWGAMICRRNGSA